jgi:hypothetical protein
LRRDLRVRRGEVEVEFKASALIWSPLRTCGTNADEGLTHMKSRKESELQMFRQGRLMRQEEMKEKQMKMFRARCSVQSG